MLEDKLSYNEQFLLKQSLKNALKVSFNELHQAIKEVKSFYELSDQEINDYLKIQMKDVYYYLKSKGTGGYSKSIMCPVYKKLNIDKLKNTQHKTKKIIEKRIRKVLNNKENNNEQ